MQNTCKRRIERGDIFYADLGKTEGSEQGGLRPVLVIQNDIGNTFSPTVIVVAITSQINKAKLPTHVSIGSSVGKLEANSIVLAEQIRTLDKNRLRDRRGKLSKEQMKKVNEALIVSLAIAV